MFTIKLYFSPENYNVICAPHYSVWFNHKSGVTEITIYKDFTSQNGVTYRVSENELEVPHWNYAYIENSSGKTIDHIK